MKEKILALLIAAFAGVRKDGLNQLARVIALQSTTYDEAKAIVDKLTEAQVNDFVKDYRADVDKELSEGNKTFETNLKKKYDFVAKTTNEPGKGGKTGKDGDNEPNDMAAMIKSAVAESVAPLQERLMKLDSENIAKSRLTLLNDKLNTCKDDNFKAKALKDFSRMSFGSDDEFNEYLKDTETDIATANQSKADADLGKQGSPLFNTKEEKTGVSTAVAEYVAEQKPENNAFAGKEV